MKRTLIDTKELILTVDFNNACPVISIELPVGATHNYIKYIRDNLLEDLYVTLGSLGYLKVQAYASTSKEIRCAYLLGFDKDLTVTI